MDGRINKNIKELRRKKNNVLSSIKEEKETLKDLIEEDINWDFFLKSVIDSDDFDVDEINIEEYMRQKYELGDISFLENNSNTINNIDVSNGTRYYKKLDQNIGVIGDRNFFSLFQDTAKLYNISPFEELSILNKMDLIVICSLENKFTGEWKAFSSFSSLKSAIIKIIKNVRSLDIPIVFFDQCDSAYFDDNTAIARECDYIFTTSKAKYNEYSSKTKNEIFHINHSVNPLLFNPINRGKSNLGEVLYEGAWRQDLEVRYILNGVLESTKNLKIMDTNFFGENTEGYFPLRFLPYSSPFTNQDEEMRINLSKLFDYVIINNEGISYINKEVYNKLAQGNIILSNYNPDINNKFPHVFIPDNVYEVSNIVEKLSVDDKYRIQLEGIRSIMSTELCFEQMEYILNKIGINIPSKEKKVLVVCDNNIDISTIKNKQSYPYVQYISKSDITEKTLDNVDFITYFSDQYEYEEYYIEDLINGFKYTDSNFVSKVDSDIGVEHFSFTNKVRNMYKTMFDVNAYTKEELITTEIDDVGNGFYIDNREVFDIKQRHTTNKLSNSEKLLSVIVPIYNNGKYLEYKCFESLKRSSIFNEMEIIFVDDGSTDEETIRIVSRLSRNYRNIILYKFNDYGSGSASRPRNKGLELSTCKYITYLDPDNEAVNDGYAKLLKVIQMDETVDVVVGNISRYDTERKEINYFNAVYKLYGTNTVDDTMDLLKNSNLKVQSIQALVTKKDIIKNNNLRMVESAAGQDTLFFQELLTKSKKLKAIDLDIHVYFAAVENSVTNTVTSKFFEKYYKLEVERYKTLRANNLFDIYINNKFPNYFVNWYLKKLTSVKLGEEEKSLLILKEIYAMYKPYYTGNDPLIIGFDKYISKGKYREFILYCEEYFLNKNRSKLKLKRA